MKISYYNLSQLLQFPLPDVNQLTERIGNQLGAIEDVTYLGQQYQKIIVCRVIDCQPVVGSDHLNQCLIDDGQVNKNVQRDQKGYIQIVCGAPNVRQGILVAWLPPGTTVPETYNKQHFILETRQIAGVLSHGMLASSKELAISDDHKGILEIDIDAKPGDDFAEIYGLNDYIIDIENKMFTHRPDCFGQLGIAREVAGILNQPFKSPSWYDLTNEHNKEVNTDNDKLLPFEVTNDLPLLVPRFCTISLANVSGSQKSPIWLQIFLTKASIRPISLLVDITNYIMILTGQPLHVYDYDKLKNRINNNQGNNIIPQIIIRSPLKDEKLKLLNGRSITLDPSSIVIADSKGVIGLAGVMGGSDTEVDSQTSNIIIESATFDMFNIRRTGMKLGIFSEALTRFTKGQSPLQNKIVLDYTVQLIKQLSASNVRVGMLTDNNQLKESIKDQNSLAEPLDISTSYINERLGTKLSISDINQLLKNVEFKINIIKSDYQLRVIVPFWRTDIEIKEDIIEEVGRLYGLDKLPKRLPVRELSPAKLNTLIELKDSVRSILAGAGANEFLTYSFIHGQLLDQMDIKQNQAYKLANAVSPDLQYYRPSLTPSLLNKVHQNIKAGFNEFAIYEIAKNVEMLFEVLNGILPNEKELLSLVYVNNNKQPKNGAAYYWSKYFLEYLFNKLNIKLIYKPANLKTFNDYIINKPFNPYRSAEIYLTGDNQEQYIGVIGEYKNKVKQKLKLPDYCAGYEIYLENIVSLNHDHHYVKHSKYPSIRQDLCLKVPLDLSYQDLFDFLVLNLENEKPEDSLITFSPLDIYKRTDESQYKQITFRIEVESYLKTLTEDEVADLLMKVSKGAQHTFNAQRI